MTIKKGRVRVRDGGEMQIVRELTEAINSVLMSPVVFYHGVCSIPLTALVLWVTFLAFLKGLTVTFLCLLLLYYLIVRWVLYFK